MSNQDGAISREDDILQELLNLAISRFNWEGLPYGLTSEQLERMLIEYGEMFGFEDRTKGIMILPCHGTEDYNVYGLPTTYEVFSLNGQYNEPIDVDNGVLLRNNPLGSPDLYKLEVYAKRLDNIEMTEEVNLFQQNIPKIILSDENSKLSAKALIDKIKKFKFAIFGKKSLVSSISQSDVLDTTAPYLLDKLSDYKQVLKSEILTYLGIKNNNVLKRERVNVDEVNSNNEYTAINLDLMYDMRVKFCNEFNAKYGTNLRVEKREVKVDGELYNPTEGDN